MHALLGATVVIGLAAGILASGLFAGVMLMLVAVLDRTWRALPAAQYAAAVRPFLEAARGNPAITVVTFVQFAAPVPAVVVLATTGDWSRFWPTVAGVVAAVLPLVVTLRFNFAIYDTVLGWPAQPPPDWARVRDRFRRLNAVRFALAAAAAALYLTAGLQ